MWKLSDYRIEPAQLERSLLDPDDAPTHQLRTGEIQLINMIELVNWGDDALQFVVCHCGVVGCETQNWVSLRNAGDIVVLIPAFAKQAAADAWMKAEYGPPFYLLERGAMYLEPQDYGQLCDRLSPIASIPLVDSLPKLSTSEAAKIIQLEAPHSVLGRSHQSIQLSSDVVIASTKGSFIEQVPELLRLLHQLESSELPVRLRPLKPGEEAIAFYLDIAGIPQWPALSFDGSAYSLYVHPGYVIEVGEFEP